MSQPTPLSPADLSTLAALKAALGSLPQSALADGELCAAAGRLIEAIDRVSTEGATPAPPFESVFDE